MFSKANVLIDKTTLIVRFCPGTTQTPQIHLGPVNKRNITSYSLIFNFLNLDKLHFQISEPRNKALVNGVENLPPRIFQRKYFFPTIQCQNKGIRETQECQGTFKYAPWNRRDADSFFFHVILPKIIMVPFLMCLLQPFSFMLVIQRFS